MTERHRFILQAYHPEYACPAFEAMFAVERLEDLQQLLGADAERDPDLQGNPLARAGRPCRNFPALRRSVRCGGSRGGSEKLARFHDECPPHEHGWEEQFDRFEALGLLHKEVDVERFDKPHRYRSGRVVEGLRTA